MDHLGSLAGHVPVKVEPIHPELGHFGTAAKRTTVPFQDYLDSLRNSKQEGKFYLTTQYDESDDEESSIESSESSPHRPLGHKRKRSSSSSTASDSNSDISRASEAPSSSSSGLDVNIPEHPFSHIPSEFLPPPLDPVLPRPTDALADDFPLQPALMGNLVLQQTNLWLGNSKKGKSSGLHHDFHDNLYALLAGRKRFVLFPPVAFDFLHPRGTVERVHNNGLIEYTPRATLHVDHPMSNRLPLRSDGLPPAEAAQWRLLARKAKVEAAYDDAAASAGEAHLPAGRRKGKAKMSAEQEAALQDFEDSYNEVMRFLEMEEEDEEGEGEERTAVFYPEGSESEIDSSDMSDTDGEEHDDSDDSDSDSDEDMAALHPAIRRMMERARKGSPEAAQFIAQLMGSVSDQSEDDEGETQDSDEDEADSEEEVFAGFPDDSSEEDTDAAGDDDSVLEITRRPGNLPGGLRRDDADEFDDEYEDYDDLGAGELLLLGGEDGEFEVAGSDDLELGEGEGQLAAMNALRAQVAERLRRQGHEISLPSSARDAGGSDSDAEHEAAEGHSVNSSSSDEDEDADLPEEDAAELRAAMLAHIEAGGELLVEEGSDDDDGDDEGGSDDSSQSHRLELLRQRGLLEDESGDGDDSDDSDDGESGSDTEESGDFFGSDKGEGDDDDEEDWEGGLDDGEAALAALDAQAAMMQGGKVKIFAVEDDHGDDLEDREPLSFSRIDPSTLHSHFGLDDHLGATSRSSNGPNGDHKEAKTKARNQSSKARKPLRGCPAPLVADLKPGEMLYLPTSWWHEVTSEAAPNDPKDDNGNSIHMALNWWFHPPDNLSPAPVIQQQKRSKKGKGSSYVLAGGGGAASSASSNNHGQADGFSEPYRDSEVWGQIRAEVQRTLEEKRQVAQQWKRTTKFAQSRRAGSREDDGEEEEKRERQGSKSAERQGGAKQKRLSHAAQESGSRSSSATLPTTTSRRKHKKSKR